VAHLLEELQVQGPKMKRIIAAIDGSETSSRVVDFAAELAIKFAAELFLIDVVDHGWPPEWALAEYVRPEHSFRAMAEFAESIARESIKRARAQADERGVTEIRQEVRFGDPAEEILKFREEVNADTIVVGSRGHGRLGGLLLGSVSQKLASLAPCSVVIVR